MEWYQELSYGRDWSDPYGPDRLKWSEIQSWSTQTEVILDDWELAGIWALDLTYRKYCRRLIDKPPDNTVPLEDLPKFSRSARREVFKR